MPGKRNRLCYEGMPWEGTHTQEEFVVEEVGVVQQVWKGSPTKPSLPTTTHPACCLKRIVWSCIQACEAKHVGVEEMV